MDDSVRDWKERLLIIIVIALAAVAGIFALLHFGTVITPAQSHIEVSYSEQSIAVPEYEAKLLGNDIHDQIQVTNDIKTGVVGRYYIEYRFLLFGKLPIRNAEVPVDIRDTEAPKIYLRNGNISFNKLHEDPALPEYAVTDDYDEQPSVSIDGMIDQEKEGIYPARVRACDQSANCTTIDISVVVGDISNEDLKPGRFDLRSYFDSSVILDTAAEPIGSDDFRKIYFIGDSNILNMGIYESDISASRVIAQYTLSPSTFDSTVWYNGDQVNVDALTIITQTQPDTIVMDIGKSELDMGGQFYAMIKQYKKVIQDIQAASPSTRIVICSLLPTAADVDGKATQTELNAANYCLASMCRDMHLQMLYTAEAFYQEGGYADADLYNEDGYNLKGVNFSQYTQYIKDHLTAK